jgi:hypothetical protein
VVGGRASICMHARRRACSWHPSPTTHRLQHHLPARASDTVCMYIHTLVATCCIVILFRCKLAEREGVRGGMDARDAMSWHVLASTDASDGIGSGVGRRAGEWKPGKLFAPSRLLVPLPCEVSTVPTAMPEIPRDRLPKSIACLLCRVPSRRRLNKDKQHRLHLRLTCTTRSCCDSDVVLRRLVQSGAAPGPGRHCCDVAVETLTLSLFATPHIQCCLLYITPLSYLGLGLGSCTICPISPINPS